MTPFHDHSDTHLAGRVLERITDEHLTPRPRWEFILKNYFFWAFGALSVIIGAGAFSAVLFEVANVDWRLSPATHANFLSFFFAAAPFLWVGTLTFFILIGYINVRRTEHGYRYPLAIIILGAILTSITLGSGLYAVGLGAGLEESIGDHPPFYRPILIQQQSWWLAPEKGLLGGEVTQVAPNIASFSIRDFTGRLWKVDGSDLQTPDIAAIARGGIVRIVGPSVSTTSSAFHACFVFPWETSGIRRMPLPPPLAAISSTSRRSEPFEQSEICKNIHPYQQLRDIEWNGQ